MQETPLRRHTDLPQHYQDEFVRDFRQQKILFYACMTIIFSALISMTVFAYWKVKPYDPIHLTQYKADVDPDPVTADGNQNMTVSFDYCKSYVGKAKVTRTLIGDRISVNLPIDNQVPLETGCHTAKRALKIPKLNNVGTYHIHYKIEYQANPVRVVTYEYDTYDFQVVKGANADDTGL